MTSMSILEFPRVVEAIAEPDPNGKKSAATKVFLLGFPFFCSRPRSCVVGIFAAISVIHLTTVEIGPL